MEEYKSQRSNIGRFVVAAVGSVVWTALFFAVIGVVWNNIHSADAKNAEVASPIIWTVSGPFESREQQGSGRYFLLDHPTEGRRMVEVAQVTGVTITQIPSAVVEMGVSFEEGGDTHYRPILWSKE